MGIFGDNGKEDAKNAIDLALANSQFLLVQDFNHSSEKINGFVHSKDFVKDLENAGVKHLVMEGDITNQKFVDAYQEGKIDRNVFVKEAGTWINPDFGIKPEEYGRMVANTLDQAKKSGISVLYLENSNNQPFSCLKDRLEKCEEVNREGTGNYKTVGDYREHFSKVGSEGAKQSLKALDYLGVSDSTSLNDPKFKEQVDNKFFEGRNNADKKLADDIAKVSDGEKTAVVYGSAHGNKRDGKTNGKDLDENLADHGKTSRIGVISRGSWIGLEQSKEMPATMITTDGTLEEKSSKIEVRQYEGKPIGGEVNLDETGRENYKQMMKDFDFKKFQSSVSSEKAGKEVAEANLGNVQAPSAEVAAQGHMQQKAAEQSTSNNIA